MEIERKWMVSDWPPEEGMVQDGFYNDRVWDVVNAVRCRRGEPLLYGIPVTSKQHSEAKRLLKLLDYFLPMPTEDIANTSLIREFIGGSCFNV